MKWRGRWYFIKPWKNFFSNLFSTWEKCVSLNCGNFCRTTHIYEKSRKIKPQLINAKFREGFSIFGIRNLWNFYVKHYKTFIQKLKEKHKKYYPISGTCFHCVISVLHLYFLVLVPYFATRSVPLAPICECNEENCEATAKKKNVEYFLECKILFKIFLTHSFNLFTLASNFFLFFSYYFQIESFFYTVVIFGCVVP